MPPKGLLTVVGSLDVSQFWPATTGGSSSDGDTVHLKVNPQSSFVFATSPGKPPRTTTKYAGAYVVDVGKKKVVITTKSEIKIRLQGIDAPETHFPPIVKTDPTKKGPTDFRQPFGASAAKALHDHLMSLTSSGTVIPATFVSHIDKPGDAVDSHGRFVGDILVGTAAAKSVNTWMVENGWAFPLFYDSMTAQEIQTLLNAWKAGKKVAGRAGKALAKALQPFDPTLTIKNAKVPDGGPLNFPKIFRRQATFWKEVPGPLPGTQFVQMLKAGAPGKGQDLAYPLAYFLANINKLNPHKRVPLISRIGSQGQTNFEPPDLVFKEDPSKLFSPGGSEIKSFS